MAVFTEIQQDTLIIWLQQYDLGALRHLEAIGAGSENSNYFLTVGESDCVLTLFERIHPQRLPYYFSVMRHLEQQGLPVPHPIANRQQQNWAWLQGKPATLFERLPGEMNLTPSWEDCAQLGQALATLHQLGPATLPYPYGLAWVESISTSLIDHLETAQRALLIDELDFQRRFQGSVLYADLPHGFCHGDLFRDNALFVTEASGTCRLSGIVDFYFCGHDKWLLDLAICANDWCWDPKEQQLDPVRTQALLQAYHRRRPFKIQEIHAWSAMLRLAALRFWCSRLQRRLEFDPHHQALDPTWFENMLAQHRAGPTPGFN